MLEGNLGEVKRVADADRISELPDFIQHSILSALDTKEACRASVLSKRWYVVWSSIPVLDFRPEYFSVIECGLGFADDKVRHFMGFIDKTMQRYFAHRYRITRMYLELPYIDENLDTLVDKWIMIAVQNNIQNLEIRIVENYYILPEILFRAKSLKVLKCIVYELPYYETMELISLESLTLYPTDMSDMIDTNMLQRLISLCPLVEFDISCGHLEKIALPWMREVNRGVEGRGSETMKSNIQASPLQKFVYDGPVVDAWPWNMNVVALKNLRKLEIVNASITDDIVSEMAYGLVALESLVLKSCLHLKCIKISSISLKVFQLIMCPHLIKVIIDTPNLLEFWCNCNVEETSVSTIRALDQCVAQFCPIMTKFISTSWFVKLNLFLFETNMFKSLVIEMHGSLEIAVEVEEQLRNVMSSPPYKLKELKLRHISDHNSSEHFLSDFLDGVFWSCHPDLLSITTGVSSLATKSILNILKCKVKCWKHPLKSAEVKSIDGSNLLSEVSEMEFRFRLSWSEV